MEEIISHSRKRYTIPTEKVEEMIVKRRNRYEDIDAGLDEIQKELDHYILEKSITDDVEEELLECNR